MGIDDFEHILQGVTDDQRSVVAGIVGNLHVNVIGENLAEQSQILMLLAVDVFFDDRSSSRRCDRHGLSFDFRLAVEADPRPVGYRVIEISVQVCAGSDSGNQLNYDLLPRNLTEVKFIIQYQGRRLSRYRQVGSQ